MSKRKKYFILAFLVLMILTLIVGGMVGRDNNGIAGQGGWKPSPLLRFFNGDPICKLSGYSSGNTSCSRAYNDENTLADCSLLGDFLFILSSVVYFGIRWYKKRKHLSS
jgi:hypothetical protein